MSIAEFILKAWNLGHMVDSFFLEAGGAKYIRKEAYGIWIFPDDSEIYYDIETGKWMLPPPKKEPA